MIRGESQRALEARRNSDAEEDKQWMKENGNKAKKSVLSRLLAWIISARFLRRLRRSALFGVHFVLDKVVIGILFISRYLILSRAAVRKHLAGPLRRVASYSYKESRRLPDAHRVNITEIQTSSLCSDGVELHLTLYLPVDPDPNCPDHGPLHMTNADKFPTILTRTPYGRFRLGPNEARFFCERGYAVIIQDTRGRFGSGGDFFPVKHEIADGGDTIDWIKQQPWSDGQVVLYGVSYLGLTTYAAAGSRMKDVAAMVPVMTCAKTHSLLYHSGDSLALDLTLRWLWLAVKLLNNMQAYKFFIPGMQGELNEAFAHAPIKTADAKLMGKTLDFLQEAMAAPGEDHEFWKDKNVLCNTNSPERPPMHLIAGFRDFFCKQSFEDFQSAAKTPGGKDARLTVGGWHHWQFTDYAPPSLVLALDFFNKTLNRDVPQTYVDVNSADRARIHVSFLETEPTRWGGFNEWPPACAHDTSVALSGMVGPQPRAQGPVSRYTYDPVDPTPCVGGPSFDPHNNGRKQQNELEDRDDVAVFSAPAQATDLWVAGDVFVDLHAATSNPYTDFFFKLCVVDESGNSFNVTEAIQRFTPNDFFTRTDKAGFESMYEIRRRIKVGPIAVLFRKGTSIRLQVAGGAHPLYCRNMGTDTSGRKGFHEIELHEMRPANHEVFHDSQLVLPVLSEQDIEQCTMSHPAYPDSRDLAI